MTLSSYELLKDLYPFNITVPQFAEITNTHPTTVNAWIRDGAMPVPSIVIQGVRRIRLYDLCQYLDGLATVERPKQGPEATMKRGRGRPRKVDVVSLSHSMSHA